MKKIIYLISVILLLFTLSACKNNSKNILKSTTYSSFSETNVDVMTTYTTEATTTENVTLSNNKLLFSTDLSVVDYIENAVIVSKNNGMLYGVLDNNGVELIPVAYDKIIFANKDNYISGKNEKFYFIATYESDYFIFDETGKELFRSQNYLSFIDCFTDNNSPFFSEKLSNDEYAFYNKNLDLIGIATANKALEGKTGSVQALSDTCYIYKEPTAISGSRAYSKVYIYDYNGNIINRFDGYESAEVRYNSFLGAFTKDEYILPLVNGHSLNLPTDYTVFHLDQSGKTISKEELTVSEYQEKYSDSSDEKTYKLYSSNSTWKLEDLSANPLLDERYYNKIDAEGENECIILMNEDYEVCVFNRNGILCIDYGILTYNNETLEMLTFNSKIRVDDIYEGAESVIIPIPSSSTGYYDIYYFAEKK